MKKPILKTIAFISGVVLLMSMTYTFPNEWKAPKEADSKINPLMGNENATAEGKKIFDLACYICHGSQGKGDGIASAALNPKPKNLTSDIVQNQSDGAIFWKITTGNTPMASYETVYTEEQRWQLVNYIRSLKKK